MALGSIGGGVGNVTSTILVRMKGDTKDLDRAIKKSRGEMRKMLKEQKQLTEDANAKLDKQITRWAKVGAGIIAVAGAWKTAQAAIARYQENSRLAAAAGAIDIQGLQRASKGLIRETDLLRLAAADQTSTMKLNQKQLEGVAGTMARLISEGRRADEVLRDFTQAVSEEGSEQLGKFGLNVAGAAKGVDSFNRLIEESARLGRDWSTGPADEMEKASVSLDDAVDDLASAVGELASSFAPLVSALARGISFLANFREELGATTTNALRFQQAVSPARSSTAGRFLRSGFGRVAAGAAGLAPVVEQTGIDKTQQQITRQLQQDLDRQRNAKLDQIVRGLVAGSQGIGAEALARSRTGRGRRGRRGRAAGRSFAPGLSPAETDRLVFNQGGPGFGDQFSADPGLGALGGAPDLLRADAVAESRFGETPFDDPQKARAEEIQRALQAAQPGIELFAGAAQSAFGAIITGSDSAANAVRKFAGQFLLAKGTMLAGEAVAQGVQALVHIAIGNLPGAAAAGKAAAAAAAGSVALGAMARALGVKGNIPGARGGGAGIGATGFGGRAQTVNRTIILGDGVLTGSRRRNAANIRRALDESDKESGDPRAVGSFS